MNDFNYASRLLWLTPEEPPQLNVLILSGSVRRLWKRSLRASSTRIPKPSLWNTSAVSPAILKPPIRTSELIQNPTILNVPRDWTVCYSSLAIFSFFCLFKLFFRSSRGLPWSSWPSLVLLVLLAFLCLWPFWVIFLPPFWAIFLWPSWPSLVLLAPLCPWSLLGKQRPK